MTVREARRGGRAAGPPDELEDGVDEPGCALGPEVRRRSQHPGRARTGPERAHEAPRPSAQPARSHERDGLAPRGLAALICALARPVTGRRYRRARMKARRDLNQM